MHKTNFTPFGEVSHIVSAYAGTSEFYPTVVPVEREVNAILNQIWQKSESHRYIDWVLCDRIIAFQGVQASPQNVKQFLKDIYPLLLDIATNPYERIFFTKLVRTLKFYNSFLSIIPTRIYASCLYAPPGADSFQIMIRMDGLRAQIMSDNYHTWHVGSSSFRSILLHELIHVDHLLQEKWGCRSSKTIKKLSCCWTNQEEMETIYKQNRFSQIRGDMMRLTHKPIDLTFDQYQILPSIAKLGFALQFGADGTVHQLCASHLTSSATSPTHIPFKVGSFTYLAEVFIIDVPNSRQIIHKKIDILFQENVRYHKKLALINILNMLQHTGEFAFIKCLVKNIQNISTKRDDLIPFISALQIAYKF